MKKTAQEELSQRLGDALRELDRLSEQILRTQDLSGSAELVLTLRELVKEQMGVRQGEDSRSSTYAPR